MTDIAATAADRLLAQRLRVIAAIHALAQFLADYPDVPTPYEIRVWASPSNGPDAQRIAQLDRLADDHEGERVTLERHEYAHLHLGTGSSHGADLRYTLATTRKDTGQ